MGVCGCAVPDTDSDMDGVPDCIDGVGLAAVSHNKLCIRYLVPVQ